MHSVMRINYHDTLNCLRGRASDTENMWQFLARCMGQVSNTCTASSCKQLATEDGYKVISNISITCKRLTDRKQLELNHIFWRGQALEAACSREPELSKLPETQLGKLTPRACAGAFG